MSPFLSHFWRIVAGYRILSGSFFSLSTLNVSTHCLPGFKVSAEKSAYILLEDPLYVINCFSLAAFKILSLSLVFEYNVSLYGSLWVHCSWSSLNFLDVCICDSSNLGSFWLLCFQIFSLPLSVSLILLGLPQCVCSSI